MLPSPKIRLAGGNYCERVEYKENRNGRRNAAKPHWLVTHQIGDDDNHQAQNAVTNIIKSVNLAVLDSQIPSSISVIIPLLGLIKLSFKVTKSPQPKKVV